MGKRTRLPVVFWERAVRFLDDFRNTNGTRSV
jgi:hypothetical protein